MSKDTKKEEKQDVVESPQETPVAPEAPESPTQSPDVPPTSDEPSSEVAVNEAADAADPTPSSEEANESVSEPSESPETSSEEESAEIVPTQPLPPDPFYFDSFESYKEALDAYKEFFAHSALEAPVQDDPSETATKLSTVATGESWPTASGYAPGTYPEAQAQGLQFDKPDKPASVIATGKQEEAKLSKVSEPGSVEKDIVGREEQ